MFSTDNRFVISTSVSLLLQNLLLLTKCPFAGVLYVLTAAYVVSKVELRLTRYNGGGKGPLIAVHGMGTSRILYSLDTIPTNFVEYFLERGYDVWLFDTRLSTACPWISTLHNYSIDDIIKYDIPVAIDTVLEKTGEVSF